MNPEDDQAPVFIDLSSRRMPLRHPWHPLINPRKQHRKLCRCEVDLAVLDSGPDETALLQTPGKQPRVLGVPPDDLQ